MEKCYRIYIKVPRDHKIMANDYLEKSGYYTALFKSFGATNIKLIGCHYVETDLLNIVISMFITCTEKQLTAIILKTDAQFDVDNNKKIE